MKDNIVRNWGYHGPNDTYGDLKITNGQCFAGFIAGILVADTKEYKPVGHIANARTFPYGVRYSVVKSITDPNADEETIIAEIKEKVLQLEIEGCRFIVSDGGLFGKYQKLVAATVDLPVFMTSLIQLKWIKIGLKADEKILVLSDLAAAQAEEVFQACGVPEEVCDSAVYIQIDKSRMDAESVYEYLEKNNVLAENNIKAVLLDTQIFAGTGCVKDRLGVNVWDMYKLMGYVKKAVSQKPREGFL